MADTQKVRIVVNASGMGEVWIDGFRVPGVQMVQFCAAYDSTPDVLLHLVGVDVEIEAEAEVEVERG